MKMQAAFVPEVSCALNRWDDRVVPFVYHLCADDFRGTSLFPLNALRVAHPDVYDRECTKWAGRESVLQWQVPHLGVAWGDTVNLAALDPVHLIQARKRLGVPYSRLLERRVVRIPVQRIAHQLSPGIPGEDVGAAGGYLSRCVRSD